MKQSIKINGMNCMHCVHAVKEALSEVEGVKVLDVQVGSAEFEADAALDMNKVYTAIEEAGYEVVK